MERANQSRGAPQSEAHLNHAMKPRPVTTTIRINREAAENLLVNITANFTPATGNGPDDGADVTDITATIAENVEAEDGQLLYTAGDRIDLTEDEEDEAASKIQNEQNP